MILLGEGGEMPGRENKGIIFLYLNLVLVKWVRSVCANLSNRTLRYAHLPDVRYTSKEH